jgi:hypothetical protein
MRQEWEGGVRRDHAVGHRNEPSASSVPAASVENTTGKVWVATEVWETGTYIVAQHTGCFHGHGRFRNFTAE